MTFVFRRFEVERHTDCFSGLWGFWRRIFRRRTDEERELRVLVREEVTMVDIVQMAEEVEMKAEEDVVVVDVNGEEDVLDVNEEEEVPVVDVKVEEEVGVVDIKAEEEIMEMVEDEDNEGEWQVVEKRRRQRQSSPVSRPANHAQVRRYKRPLYKPVKFFAKTESSVAAPQPEIIDRQEDHKATNKHHKKAQKKAQKTGHPQQQTRDKRSKQKRTEHNKKVMQQQQQHKRVVDTGETKTDKKSKKSKKNKKHQGKPVKKTRKTKAEKMAKMDKVARIEKKQRRQGRRLARKHHKK